MAQPITKTINFLRETRKEIAKVTWPTRKEVVTTTIMVGLMAIAFGLFFFVVDWAAGYLVGKILGMR